MPGPFLSRRRWTLALAILVAVLLLSLRPVFTDAQQSPPPHAVQVLDALRDSAAALDKVGEARGSFPQAQDAALGRAKDALTVVDDALAAGDRKQARRAARVASENLHAVWLWLDAQDAAAQLTPKQQRALFERTVERAKRRIERIRTACADAAIQCADDDARAALQAFKAAAKGTDLAALQQALVELTVQVRRVEATLMDKLEEEGGQ